MVRRLFLFFSLISCLVLVDFDPHLYGQEAGLVECKIGGRQVKMLHTGSAVRTKRFFKIYAIDSYVEQGVKIRTAQDMIGMDQAKQLRILMLRNVTGPNMAEAFTEILRANHPEPAFNEEVETVGKILRSQTAKKGEEIWFTHVPNVGLHCKTSEGMNYLILNVEFSKAVWENYFGNHNVGENVKQALLSRLPKE